MQSNVCLCLHTLACLKLVVLYVHTARCFYSYLWNIWPEGCYSNSLPRLICLQTFMYCMWRLPQAEPCVRMYNSSTTFCQHLQRKKQTKIKQHASPLVRLDSLGFSFPITIWTELEEQRIKPLFPCWFIFF